LLLPGAGVRTRKHTRSVQTEKNLDVLCFEHHTQMRPSQILLKIGEKSGQMPAYVCEEPGCFVRYTSSRGYFVTSDGRQIEGELTPLSVVQVIVDLCILLRCALSSGAIACGDVRSVARVSPMSFAGVELNRTARPLRKSAASLGKSRFCYRSRTDSALATATTALISQRKKDLAGANTRVSAVCSQPCHLPSVLSFA
jgi:hypothetical protein